MIFVTDMDGTLAHQGVITPENLEALKDAQKKGITTIVATGRNLYSSKMLMPPEFPINYLIFSTGVGVLAWQEQEIIFQKNLEREFLLETANILVKENVDFCIQKEIPDNHFFYFFKNKHENHDFNKRLHLYYDYSTPLNLKEIPKMRTSQVVAILPPHEVERFEEISKKLPAPLSIVRSTSPLDKQSLWIEILPPNTNKGTSLMWLIDKMKASGQEIWAIGNDYNDIDFLEVANHKYVVENAPDELKAKYQVMPEALESGVAKLLKLCF